MSAEAHALTAPEYIGHHLRHLQNKLEPQAIVDWSYINIDSIFWSFVLGALAIGLLWKAASRATSGVPGRFQAAVEILVERLLSPTLALTQLRASHAPKPGTRLTIVGRAGSPVPAEVTGRDDRFFVVQLLDGNANFETLMREAGELPLPPYMQRAAGEGDTERYQTVYARSEGAVAAPTAGLHFDEATLAACRERDIAMTHVTLHVGAGTFLPVKSENIVEHRMHAEVFQWQAVGPDHSLS